MKHQGEKEKHQRLKEKTDCGVLKANGTKDEEVTHHVRCCQIAEGLRIYTWISCREVIADF